LSWLRSPLLHFLALGVLIFVANEVREGLRVPDDASATRRIEIDAARIETLEREFITQMGRAPDADELAGLLTAEIDEEILYREALSRGLLERDGGVQTRMIQKMLFLEGKTEIEDARALLDRARELELHRDDIVVRRILVQKMRLLGSMLDAEERPSAEDIASRYAETRESFREPDRISFGHVFLSADDRRESTLEDARALAVRLEAEAIDLESAIAIGDPFPLGSRFMRRSERDLSRSFGAHFATRALTVEPGRWSQPIESAYGQHLVWIESRETGQSPPLEAVAERIRRELERELEAAKLEALLGVLQNRYEVVVQGASKEIG
jgi:hypothetical protein